MTKTFNWTDQSVAEARKLFDQGESFGVIAAAIGCPSRNAVIGKVHRLGWARRRPKVEPKAASLPAPERNKPPRPVNFARKPSRSAEERRDAFQAVADKALEKFEVVVEVVRGDDDPGVPFLARGAFQCAMPMPGWDELPVTGKMVCGRPVAAGTSWCPACLSIVSVPPKLAAMKMSRTMKGIAA